MENQKGKYYFCLDKQDYTLYDDEKEVLLQAGLVGKITNIKLISDDNGDVTIFKLFISDKMV